MKNPQRFILPTQAGEISIPYCPVGAQTHLVGGREVAHEMVPPYVAHLKRFAEAQSNISALDHAILSIRREIALEMVRASAVRFENIIEGPVALSAGVPFGQFVETPTRIIVNETWALQRFIDADGDRIFIIRDGKGFGVAVKFPITMQPAILREFTGQIKENFEDFGLKEAEALKENFPVIIPTEEEVLKHFLKSHTDVPVGLLTTAHNVADLEETASLSYDEKLKVIFNTSINEDHGLPQRAVDIEIGGMKAARKDTFSGVVSQIGNGRALVYPHAHLLTSSNSIGSARPYALSWTTGNLKEIMAQAMALNVDFRDINPSEETLRLVPDNILINGNLLNNLVKLGLFRWIEIPHASPNMPPSVMIMLTRPNGTAVALTDVKRGDQPEGLTYGFLMAPVFDNMDLTDKDGKVIDPAPQKWTHPIAYLARRMATFDSAIRWDGQVRGYWPKNVADFDDPKRAVKATLLLAFITNLCSEIGDAAPCQVQNGQVTPSGIAVGVIKRSLVIDYGQNMTEYEMLKVAKIAHEQHAFCMGGSKSTNRRIRKYMLTNAQGGAVLDTEGLCHPVRPAKSRAQLLRALEKVTMTTAIVLSETKNQVLITPSGVEKQVTDKAFLPRVFCTQEEYLEFLNHIGMTTEEVPAIAVDYQTWQGQARRCWTIDARSSIKVGKLIDTKGNKFMPREISQVIMEVRTDAERGVEFAPIDLIFPITELVEKENHHDLLKNAVERVLILPDGETVKAMVAELTFWRTGSASENIPARPRVARIKGMDRFPIHAKVNEMLGQPNVPFEADISFAEELQGALLELLSLRFTLVGEDDGEE